MEKNISIEKLKMVSKIDYIRINQKVIMEYKEKMEMTVKILVMLSFMQTK